MELLADLAVIYLIYCAAVFCLPIPFLLLGLMLKALIFAAPLLGRATLRGVVFLLRRAFRRGHSRRERRRRENRRRQEQAFPLPRSYEHALAILNLPPEFTRTAFDRAYRRAMMKAHPDRGGSTAHAQALNAARDLVKTRNGW